MPTFEPPQFVKRAAENLWVALLESGGDPAEVQGALDDVNTACRSLYGENAATVFGLIVGSATSMFFINSWPAVLAQLTSKGVTGDQVATSINTAMAQQVSDYLRADVNPEGVTGGN